MLRRMGCNVSVTADPQAAVELALSGQLDLVCLDIGMPYLDGYQVLTLRCV